MKKRPHPNQPDWETEFSEIEIPEIDEFGDLFKSTHADVEGSYTGRPADGGAPVQDADDL